MCVTVSVSTQMFDIQWRGEHRPQQKTRIGYFYMKQLNYIHLRIVFLRSCEKREFCASNLFEEQRKQKFVCLRSIDLSLWVYELPYPGIGILVADTMLDSKIVDSKMVDYDSTSEPLLHLSVKDRCAVLSCYSWTRPALIYAWAFVC